MKKSTTALFLGLGALAFVTSAQALPPSPAPPVSSPSSSSNEINEASPLAPSYRTTNNIQNRLDAARNSGTSAGGGYYAPKEPIVAGPSVVHTPYFEYSYIAINEDVTGTVLDGLEHVFAIGYDVSWDSGLTLGITYEYGDRDFERNTTVPPLSDQEFDSHTVAGYVSQEIFSSVYASFIGGYVNGSFESAALNVDGEGWFINPGISKIWNFGDLIVNTGISYLQNDSSSSLQLPPPVGPLANQDVTTGQVIVDLGARYNISNSLYVKGGIQYNTITSHDFGPAPANFDEDWWRGSVDIGKSLSNGMEIYGGYAHDFGQSVYDNHTFRLGVLYEY